MFKHFEIYKKHLTKTGTHSFICPDEPHHTECFGAFRFCEG